MSQTTSKRQCSIIFENNAPQMHTYVRYITWRSVTRYRCVEAYIIKQELLTDLFLVLPALLRASNERATTNDMTCCFCAFEKSKRFLEAI